MKRNLLIKKIYLSNIFKYSKCFYILNKTINKYFVKFANSTHIILLIFFTYQWKISPDLVYNDFEFVDKDIIHESIFIFISLYTDKLL